MSTKRNDAVTVMTESLSAIGFKYHTGLFSGEIYQLFGKLGS